MADTWVLFLFVLQVICCKEELVSVVVNALEVDLRFGEVCLVCSLSLTEESVAMPVSVSVIVQKIKKVQDHGVIVVSKVVGGRKTVWEVQPSKVCEKIQPEKRTGVVPGFKLKNKRDHRDSEIVGRQVV